MTSDSEREQIVTTASDLEDDTVSFLAEMIRTRSVNPPGEYKKIYELVKDQFKAHGWETEVVWTPDEVLETLGLDPAYPRPNVLGYVTRGEGPTIVLNAHLDTVPVDESEEWSYEPFDAEIDGNRIYGRGANDSKGRIAAYTLAGRILEEVNLVPDDATVVLAITCDEETGGQAGPGYLIESGVLDPDYAIVEGNCDEIWIGVSGVRQFEITVTGKASHAGIAPDDGANAIIGAGRILRAIEEYAEGLKNEESNVPGVGSPTCVPAVIGGGVKANIVPAECSFSVDHRVLPDYDGDDIERRFKSIIAEVDLPDGVNASVEVTLRGDPYLSSPDDVHVRSIAKNVEKIFGCELNLVGIRGFSDGRFFASAGTKTINFGPGDSDCNPHGADENISLGQVRDAGAVVAASIVDIAQI